MKSDDLKKYELAILLSSEIAEKEIDQLLSSVEIVNKSPVKMVMLAYPIKKQQSAALLVYEFRAQPEIINQLREQLRFQPSVLRLLLVAVSESNGKEERAKKAPIEVLTEKKTSTDVASNEDLVKTLERLEEQ